MYENLTCDRFVPSTSIHIITSDFDRFHKSGVAVVDNIYSEKTERNLICKHLLSTMLIPFDHICAATKEATFSSGTESFVIRFIDTIYKAPQVSELA
ncbi:uncharacterized protein PHALS_15050 [Plasmopara halstedii]|uniref:Uncharacterized protein n=1 Tax=Plasmopara halstedii TaxID=4781 RepID=A0A0P1AZ07_PLAHL|nr:uncharacterized protein PHALS_15050 [Plasmopara halstedii]CEG47693.1 hypothetical protein PHALS_15050 [Plasmopara halstedii]|eukprot:XP_024584062.1 hypothetical protein PHALS_15050 [Plasmopara halstedii]